MSGKNSDRETVTKFDGTPGVTFDVYEEGILNFAAGKTDDRGWSLADHLMESDELGPNGPLPPNNATELRKAQRNIYGHLSRRER